MSRFIQYKSNNTKHWNFENALLQRKHAGNYDGNGFEL